MEHFLYVFSKQERDALISIGYALLKSDETNDIYIFENQNELRFNVDDIQAVQSDTLTF